MNEKVIVSSVALLVSLSAYFYAKSVHKDAVPYVMIGGYAGAILGELISQKLDKNKN